MYKQKIVKTAVIAILSMSLLACATVSKKSEKSVDKLEFAGDILTFSETIDGHESTVRMIITKAYLRMDDGPEAEDYLLFDRRKKTIYNIVADEKSIMEIAVEASNIVPPYPISWRTESQSSNALMRTDNERAAKATYYLLSLNQQACYHVVAIDQGMEEALAAIREYRQVLANQLKSRYIRQAGQECYEAVNIFTPLNHLQQGFPIREWSTYGYQRFLVNYRQKIIFPKRLFALPDGYAHVKI